MGRKHVPILIVISLFWFHCGNSGGGTRIQVHVPDALDKGAQPAVDDLVRDLGVVSGEPVGVAALPPPSCRPGEVHIAVLGHQHEPDGSLAATQLGAQEYAISETRCSGGGKVVMLRGGSLLAGQWAIYDFLTRLGVRYWHPEQTYYPDHLVWPNEPLDVIARPAFQHRSMHVHRTHPVELIAPPGTVPGMAEYQRRWIDWNIKLRQTAIDGWDQRYVGSYAYERGFSREVRFNLLNSQQGGRPILDPDDPRPEPEQIAEAIDELMASVPGAPDPSLLSFQFNPSEFTVVDDVATVERLTFIANYVSERYPAVDLYTINHGTWQEPMPTYELRFFDLPQLAPPALGVQVHTLMFYDLERPAAGVYGNTDFSHMLSWLVDQQSKRRIMHYPESSWWLTFDLPVPLYLAPVTLEARQYDIDLLRPYLSADATAKTGVFGHHLFTSGQEWGYWLIDYCVAQMVWSTEFTYQTCLDDLTGQIAGGDEIAQVLRQVTARQVSDLRDPEILRFLVGSDDETEAAAQLGISLHPLPPPPSEVLGWDDTAILALEERSLAPLRAMAGAYHAWADTVEATLPMQSQAQAPWAREIRDGLRIVALRAEHAVAVYETVLALRSAIRAGDLAAIESASLGVDRARGITDAAREVVRRREAEYRYPDALTIAGGEAGTPDAIETGTIYSYRVLGRTHRMFYWERPDAQLAALFGEGVELVTVNGRILLEGTPLEVTLLANDVSRLEVDWGDGQKDRVLEPHLYAAQGVYAWMLDAIWPTGAVLHADTAAVVARRMVFAKGSLRIEEPAGASIVQGLLPGFVVGLGNDGSDFMVLGRVDGAAPVVSRGALWRRERKDLVSGPADFDLSLAEIGALTVYAAVITVEEGSEAADRGLVISGEMSTQQIIDIMVEGFGAFDREGATNLVASALGYTPETLPERVSFRIRARGTEDAAN